nr:CYTH-like domain motif-containing protein [Pandoravirus massiliensis]
MDARRRGPRSVLVGYSATEAQRHLARDTSLAVRVRWALDADAAQRMHAILIDDKDMRTARSTFVDSFYGADDMPAAGRWLRCREVTSGRCADTTSASPLAGTFGVERAWCLRVSRYANNSGGCDAFAAPSKDVALGHGGTARSDDTETGVNARDRVGVENGGVAQGGFREGAAHPVLPMPIECASHRRRRRIYVHTDECDETRLLHVVAPESAAADLSDLALGLYARITVQRVTFVDAAAPQAACRSTPPRIAIDTVVFQGGRGRTLVQGTAVVGDEQSASRLVALLCAVGVDPSAPPPPPKVAAYLAWRRPVLCARLIKRGALDEALFDAA